MRTLSINVYKYEELADDAKEKVLAAQRNVNVRFNDWFELIVDAWKCSLEEFAFFAPRIYFSGFYSQGDGACFECDSIYSDRLFESVRVEIDTFSKEFQEVFKTKEEALFNFMENYVSFTIETSIHRYCHENTRYIDWDIHSDDEKAKHFEKFIDEIGEWLEEKRKTFCKEIYQQLEEEYEEQTSDDSVIYTVSSNEYEFLEDGRLVDFELKNSK